MLISTKEIDFYYKDQGTIDIPEDSKIISFIQNYDQIVVMFQHQKSFNLNSTIKKLKWFKLYQNPFNYTINSNIDENWSPIKFGTVYTKQVNSVSIESYIFLYQIELLQNEIRDNKLEYLLYKE